MGTIWTKEPTGQGGVYTTATMSVHLGAKWHLTEACVLIKEERLLVAQSMRESLPAVRRRRITYQILPEPAYVHARR